MKVVVENCMIIDPTRKKSFWYDGQVALVCNDKRNLSIEATGAIGLYFDGIDEKYDLGYAVHKAVKLKYTDIDIDRMEKNGQFSNNNWFTIYDQDSQKYLETVDGNYDDAVKRAEDIINGID